ncbi:MAG: TSUP family transporter [Desulfofustis sp.]|nr:TSUP family transporter [Desulfofustis sp.]
MDVTVSLSSDIFILLFFVGLVSGLVDSIAGGGGLIALPALLFIGLPPQVALGTNKLQGTFGAFSASAHFIRKRLVNPRECITGIVCTLIGAVAGALLVQVLDPAVIEPLIPILLFLVFLYTLFSRHLGSTDKTARMKQTPFYIVFGLGLGFYDGFFGPGTGSLWAFALMVLLGFNMVKATGVTKVMNFISNIASLALFIGGGNVVYSIGLTMAAGQLIGGRVGSALAIKNGARIIRPLYLAIVFLTIVRLLWTRLIEGG